MTTAGSSRPSSNRLQPARVCCRARQRQENRGRWLTVSLSRSLKPGYFGDWSAVLAAYPRVRPTVPQQARYRDPDAIVGGTWEAFERVLQRHGYFRTGLRKVEAARAVAAHFDPDRSRSQSFEKLRAVIAETTA